MSRSILIFKILLQIQASQWIHTILCYARAHEPPFHRSKKKLHLSRPHLAAFNVYTSDIIFINTFTNFRDRLGWVDYVLMWCAAQHLPFSDWSCLLSLMMTLRLQNIHLNFILLRSAIKHTWFPPTGGAWASNNNMHARMSFQRSSEDKCLTSTKSTLGIECNQIQCTLVRV